MFCSAPKCRITSKTNPEIKYYTVPNNAEEKANWMNALNAVGVLAGSKICEKHFVAEDFIDKGRLKLKKGAVPKEVVPDTIPVKKTIPKKPEEQTVVFIVPENEDGPLVQSMETDKDDNSGEVGETSQKGQTVNKTGNVILLNKDLLEQSASKTKDGIYILNKELLEKSSLSEAAEDRRSSRTAKRARYEDDDDYEDSNTPQKTSQSYNKNSVLAKENRFLNEFNVKLRKKVKSLYQRCRRLEGRRQNLRKLLLLLVQKYGKGKFNLKQLLDANDAKKIEVDSDVD